MRKNRFVLACAALVLGAGALATALTQQVYGQRTRSSRNLARNTGRADRQAHVKYSPARGAGRIRAAVDAAPVFPVAVDTGLDLDQATLALYQQMATQLSGNAAVPNDRTNYYSAFRNMPHYQIGGWAGIVEDVQAVNGGNLVTVQVVPLFTTTATGVLNDYTEQYLIGNDGSIAYQGFADPNGWAGLVPNTIDL